MTKSVLGCGSNLYGQLLPDQKDVLEMLSPTELLVDSPIEELVAVSDCQLLYKCGSRLGMTGFVQGSADYPISTDILETLNGKKVKKILGKAIFTAVLTEDGHITEVAKTRRSTSEIYKDAAMNSHGRILAVEADSLKLRLFSNLDDLFSTTFTVIPLDHQPATEMKLYAGAANFVINFGSDMVYALGDNRHFQQGHDGHSSWTSASCISFFEGGSPIKTIACGNLHTAVMTEDGALYMMGSDAKGQCGGFTDREPTLVELPLHDGIEEQPDVLDVACGSKHTVILTDQGIYATGSNHVGQLGFSHTQDTPTFTKLGLSDAYKPIGAIMAQGWNTYFIA